MSVARPLEIDFSPLLLLAAVPIVLPKCGVPRISSNNIADFTPHSPSLKVRQTGNVIRKHFLLNCMNIMANDDNGTDDASYDDLKAGSPIVIIEPPPYLKTAEPMPMMRPNGGSVMPGDAGRCWSFFPFMTLHL